VFATAIAADAVAAIARQPCVMGPPMSAQQSALKVNGDRKEEVWQTVGQHDDTEYNNNKTTTSCMGDYGQRRGWVW
jgi:hypothetical protein